MIDGCLGDGRSFARTGNEITIRGLSITSGPPHLLNVVDHLIRGACMNHKGHLVVIVPSAESMRADHDSLDTVDPVFVHFESMQGRDRLVPVVKVATKTVCNLKPKFQIWDIYQRTLAPLKLSSGGLVQMGDLINELTLGRNQRFEAIAKLGTIGGCTEHDGFLVEVEFMEDEIERYGRDSAGEEDELGRKGAKCINLAERLAVMLGGGYSLHLVEDDRRNRHPKASFLETLCKMLRSGYFYRHEQDGFLAGDARGPGGEDDMRDTMLVEASLVVVDERNKGDD